MALLLITGCQDNSVQPPPNDGTRPFVQVSFYNLAPETGHTENPEVYSPHFPLAVPPTLLGRDVGVVVEVSDPESGLVWIDLTADYGVVCTNPDGTTAGRIGLAPPSLNDHSGPVLKDTDPFPPSPYQKDRIVNFTIPLSVTQAYVCPTPQKTSLRVLLTLTGRAGNGPAVSEKTTITAA